ncbi:MAG: rubredoxin [Oscillospiraceae bacterium]|nr:rubredoxin [Oscillospiraceae bacterium]
MMKLVCPLCGEVYDEELAGTPFADLPENWVCPLCMAPKSSFRPEEPPWEEFPPDQT